MRREGQYDMPEIERVLFGRPAATVLAEEAERLAAARVFVLGSRSLQERTDEIDRVRAALGARWSGIWSGMPSHTPRDAVLEASAAARDAGADLIVTIGGGSITDAGKMLQLCLQHDIRDDAGFEPFVERVQPDGSRIRPHIDPPRVRQIAVPTTLSGGEFGYGAGCTDTRRRLKQLYRHPQFAPRVNVLDPAITVHTPEWLWLSTGIRALDHAVETLCSPFANPQSDGPAMHAVRLLRRGLERSKADPSDLATRLDCQIGVWASMDHNQCGVPMGASHGIGHVLGGTCNVPHGHTSCVMLPAVLAWNRDHNRERQALVSEAMGHPGADASDVVGAFIAGLGMPRTLSDVGVNDDQFRIVAENSMHDRYIYSNPRKIAGPDDVMEILRLAA